MKTIRPIEPSDVVRISPELMGDVAGKSGIVVRLHGDSVCVVVKGVWDHGIWFSLEDIKRIGRRR